MAAQACRSGRDGSRGEKPSCHSSFLAAFLFLDRPRREAMEWIYAFCRQADDAVDEPGTPAEKEGRLAACAAELERVYTGRPTTGLGRGLAAAVARFPLDRADFEAVLAGCRMDLEREDYPDFAALELYCRRVASAVGRLCVALFGVAGDQARAYADATGIALQLTNILRDLGEDHRRGRVYLPADELARFGLARSDLDPERPPAGGTRERLAGLIAFQAERARGFYAESDRLLPRRERRRLLPGEVMKALYRQVLRRVERLGPAVLHTRARPGRLSRLRALAGTWLRLHLPP
jgi:phytoene synthase